MVKIAEYVIHDVDQQDALIILRGRDQYLFLPLKMQEFSMCFFIKPIMK
jgi:hypothetical protein